MVRFFDADKIHVAYQQTYKLLRQHNFRLGDYLIFASFITEDAIKLMFESTTGRLSKRAEQIARDIAALPLAVARTVVEMIDATDDKGGVRHDD